MTLGCLLSISGPQCPCLRNGIVGNAFLSSGEAASVLCGHAFGIVWPSGRQDRRGLEDVRDGRDGWVPHCPVSHSPGSAALTGMVWLPCRALMAACASAWEEYFTKAHPGGTGEAEPRRLDPEKGRRGARSESSSTGGAEGRGRLPQESRVRPRNTERHRETQSYTGRQRPGPAKDVKGPLAGPVSVWTRIAAFPSSQA